MEGEKVRVLIVDDHTLFRRGLVSLLGQQENLEVIGEASDGEEALEKAKELMPDVILMDIRMPKVNGLEATRRIKAEMPYVKILMLTVSDEEQDLFEAIKSGASGYLLKNLEPEELIRYLEGVRRGEAPIDPLMASKILQEFKRGIEAPRPPAGPELLTHREREILELVAMGDANKEIARKLGISENTVKNHLRNILEKLHLQNRVQAAMFAIREGLIREPPSSP